MRYKFSWMKCVTHFIVLGYWKLIYIKDVYMYRDTNWSAHFYFDNSKCSLKKLIEMADLMYAGIFYINRKNVSVNHTCLSIKR